MKGDFKNHNQCLHNHINSQQFLPKFATFENKIKQYSTQQMARKQYFIAFIDF